MRPSKIKDAFLATNDYELYATQYKEAYEHWKNNGWCTQQLRKDFVSFAESSLTGNLFARALQLRDFPNGVSLDKFICRYGESIGNARWNDYIATQSDTNSYEYKKEKYGWTRKQFDEYNASRAVTMSTMCKKYGQHEGKIRYEEYVAKQRIAGCTLGYFEEKYGKTIGAKKYKELNVKKSQTRSSYIARYGEVDGSIRFEEYVANVRSSKGYSKVSQELFWSVYDRLPDDIQKNCHFAERGGEYGKMGSNGYYLLDFYITSLDYVIEFNGDIYHANPKQYSGDDIPKFRGNTKTANEIWEYDSEKLKTLESSHHLVIDIVWEMDYNENKESVIDYLLGRIYERNNNK